MSALTVEVTESVTTVVEAEGGAAVAITLPSSTASSVTIQTPGPQGATGAAGAGGAGGGAIDEVSTYASPTLLANSAEISAPASDREKRYIAGNGGAVTGVTVAAGADTQELWLFGTHDTNTVQMVSSANVLLTGTWVARLGSMLALHWTEGLDKYVEAYRNEI